MRLLSIPTAMLTLALIIGGCHEGGVQNGAERTASDAAARSDAGTHGDAATPGDAAPELHTPAGANADGAVGSTCTADGDCDQGRCLLDEPITSSTYPDGYCTRRCAVDADCGERGVCAPGFFPGSGGGCYLGCEQDADCGRDGYRCRASGDAGICAPGPKRLPDDAVGNACASDDDCGGGPMTCTTKVGQLDAPDGYCSQRCAIDDDCGAGGICVSPVDTILISSGSCYRSCTPPGGCRDGYTCRSFSGAVGDTRGACVPEQIDDAGMP